MADRRQALGRQDPGSRGGGCWHGIIEVVDAVAPVAFAEGGPLIGLVSAAGFVVAFLLGH